MFLAILYPGDLHFKVIFGETDQTFPHQLTQLMLLNLGWQVASLLLQ